MLKAVLLDFPLIAEDKVDRSHGSCTLLMRESAEGLGRLATTGFKFLSWCCEIARLLGAPLLGTIADVDDMEEVIGGTTANFELAAGPVAAWPIWPSTGFLERWRPLFMCLSQYF